MVVAEKYKQTEVGLIPSDWEVKMIGEISKLKNGYAFSSDFFSKAGPIVITPGNFKLEGGLKFNDRNTIRYSGYISKEMQFQNGDLLIVMTDLTPDCNLLGKPGIVNSEEIILHNQRIGKITVTSNQVNQEYLYWFFVSDLFSKRMKETATGSTVRHTSVVSINNSLIAIPTKAEQTAIATALSDADALISGLEKLIAKKRNIKQGAMQKLLQPKEGWEVKKLGDVAEMYSGGTPLTSVPSYYNGNIPWVVIADITKAGKYISETEKTISHEGVSNSSAKLFKKGVLLFAMYASIGKTAIALMDTTCNQAILGIEPKLIDKEYLYYYLSFKERHFITMGQTGTQSNLSKDMVQKLEIPIPKSKEEQIQIGTILSDMDAEIQALETKLEKYRKVKLGMMQNLLTGKIRLI